MFAALDAIKNTIFSLNPLPKTISKPLDTISSVVEDDNEPIIDQPDPLANINTPLQVNIFDKRPYLVKNIETGETEEYHYLHGEHLEQTYDFCLNKSSVIKVHVCMVGLDFHCNYLGEHLPFLRFLMEYGPTTIDFPKCEILCSMPETENATAQMDTYFHNECIKRVLDFFVIEGQFTQESDFTKRLNKSYRGYREIDEGELVAVFDITGFLNMPLRKRQNPAWIVLDDILNPVLPLSPKVLHFFKENEYMKEIRDPLNNLVEIPKSLYLYDTVAHRFMEKSEKSEWLEPRSFHNTYGNFYYFKSLKTNLSENTQINEAYRKCVVFLKNYADFLEDNESVDLHGEHIEESPLSFDGTPSPDNSRTPILVSSSGVIAKSEEQHEKYVGGNNDISQQTDDLSLSDEELEPEPEPDVEQSEKGDIQNNLPFVSLIMFSEKGEPMYCVKTESIFTEL